jgi:hypothetical protein
MWRWSAYAMNNDVDQKGAQSRTANETAIQPTMEAMIAMVSYLESAIRPHNAIAAYFLERCRCALLQDVLNDHDCHM